MTYGFADRFPELSRDLGPENASTLLKSTTSLEIPAGRPIIRDRMPVDSLYLILEGEVSIMVEEGGRAIPLGRLGPGQWLGEVSVLSGELLASSTVTAETPVKLLRLKHQAFDDLLQRNPHIASALLKQLVDMLADRLRTSPTSAGEGIRIQQIAERDSPQARDGKGKNWLQSFFSKTGS
jgi:CRP-like cAMP-binding protein